MQWRPMDEEPPHTMRVLLFKPEAYHPEWDGADYGISVGYFSNGEWRDQGTNHDAFEYTAPTHWMPLPPPPEDKSDESPEGKAAIEGAAD